MFAVLFEVHPKSEQFDAYLGYAKMLRPELEQIDGFIDNIRYRSLTREGWILSLSTWRDEKALVRWRTQVAHHAIQQKGRDDVFLDYHLRVGQLTSDTQLPDGMALTEQRLDETETGDATTVTLMTTTLPARAAERAAPTAIATWLDLTPNADGLVAWDCFDAVLSPGDRIALVSWRDRAGAEAYETRANFPEGARLRGVRIVRDYGMFDRREAPQYYPDAVRSSR